MGHSPWSHTESDTTGVNNTFYTLIDIYIYISLRNENIGLHKNQYMNVSRGIIHNDQKVEMKY